MRALVTGANGDVADGVGRAIRDAHPDTLLVGADVGDEWPARDVFEQVHRLPPAHDVAYVDALRELVSASGADLVIPCSEPELVALAASDVRDLPLLMVEPSLVLTLSDKLDAAAWLREHGIPAPATARLADADPSQLPLVVKPRRGSGSRGVTVVHTEARLALEKAERAESAVAQEYLDDDDAEITCALLRIGGDLRTLQLRRRLAGGMTVAAVVVDDPEVSSVLRAIADATRHTGSINVQLRIDRDGPKVFEINPRLSSTTKMRHDAGFCDLLWWMAAMRGETLPAFTPVAVGTRLFRGSREIVVRP